MNKARLRREPVKASRRRLERDLTRYLNLYYPSHKSICKFNEEGD